MSEIRVDRLESRLERIEEDVRGIKTTLANLSPMIININATVPHLATKAELADKPSRGYLWGVMAAMVGAQAVALAAAALIFSVIQARSPGLHASLTSAGIVLAGDQPPYSCRLYYDEQKKCAFGSCDARTVERLKRECLRDGGRP